MNSSRKLLVFTSLLFVVTIIFSQNQPNFGLMKGENDFYIGAAYYPEQIAREQVIKDAKLMRDAHFNIARIGDFAWSSMQPKNGVFTLDWLDFSIDELSKSGIQTLLCTPTAAIPKWMVDASPNIMQISSEGERKPYGRRRHACVNNETYRNYSIQIAETLAKRYSKNPAVIGFQIDNEICTEDPYCYCPVCQQKFALWLNNKYGSIEKLNKVWGTAFWSQTLNDFNEVWLPRKKDNPSAYQDFQKFNSDCVIEFIKLQSDVIKKAAPRMLITHNIGGGGFVSTIDLYKLSKNLDVLAVDNYPANCTLENNYQNQIGQAFDPAMVSFALQQIRGGRAQNIWANEVQVGRTALTQRTIVAPGTVRLWIHQQLAYGVNMNLFFPFRAFESAHEHMMAGVVESDNLKRAKYYEIQKTAEETRAIYAKTGKMFPIAKAAVIRDFESDWAFDNGCISSDLKYMRQVFSYYKGLREQCISTDLVSPEADLTKYKLIVVPYQVVVSPDFGKKLKEIANQGATIIVTCVSGMRDRNMTKINTLVQKEIQEAAGIEIEEQFALFALKKNELIFENKKSDCGLWFDQFKPTTAKTIATFSGNYLKNSPAITRNEIGKGVVYYVGTVPDQEVINGIMRNAITDSKLSPIAKSSNSLVDISELISADGKRHFIYAVNFSDTTQEIVLDRPIKSLINGEICNKNASIQARDFAIFEY